MTERSFFELLSLHSIRVLYDFRGPPAIEGVHELCSAPERRFRGSDGEQGPSHFKPSHLEGACKRHSVHYRFAPLGREGAYGILKHLKEDEGRNMLAELVWWARRKRTAFLGKEADWRQDHRAAVASRLAVAGHGVKHVSADGALEDHPHDFEMPDFIAGEEVRLRRLEKQRLAGDLARPTKSATSRSTEVVAQRLTQPQKVIDAAAELRKANTQAELCRIQRRLADVERRSASSDAKAGLGPKLLHVNKWVKAQAEEQRENLAAGKTKDGKDKDKLAPGGPAPSYSWTGSGGTCGGNPDFLAAASSSDVPSASDCDLSLSHDG
ncbi:SWEET14, partial [Symbiodinium microadriaticum]